MIPIKKDIEDSQMKKDKTKINYVGLDIKRVNELVQPFKFLYQSKGYTIIENKNSPKFYAISLEESQYEKGTLTMFVWNIKGVEEKDIMKYVNISINNYKFTVGKSTKSIYERIVKHFGHIDGFNVIEVDNDLKVYIKDI